jgi:pantothenate kinase type III
VVVVDMGTATTFDIIGPSGRYEGGMISPGLMISAQALFSRAAMLSNIELKHPPTLIGKNTRDAMLSGIVYGYVGLVDGILARFWHRHDDDRYRRTGVSYRSGVSIHHDSSTRAYPDGVKDHRPPKPHHLPLIIGSFRL